MRAESAAEASGKLGSFALTSKLILVMAIWTQVAAPRLTLNCDFAVMRSQRAKYLLTQPRRPEQTQDWLTRQRLRLGSVFRFGRNNPPNRWVVSWFPRIKQLFLFAQLVLGFGVVVHRVTRRCEVPKQTNGLTDAMCHARCVSEIFFRWFCGLKSFSVFSALQHRDQFIARCTLQEGYQLLLVHFRPGRAARWLNQWELWRGIIDYLYGHALFLVSGKPAF